MNENALHSDEQAALLDAHKQTRALLKRYRYLANELIDDESLKPFLAERRQELEELRHRLEAGLDRKGMLPEDINTDLEDLAQLADRFREWLDGDRHEPLKRALAERERSLFDALCALPESERYNLARAIDGVKATIDELSAD